jgi:nucleoside-diphosphate-sugar epimerase
MLVRPERADELKATEGAVMDWKGSPTVVTGGASFIGSHLVERCSHEAPPCAWSTTSATADGNLQRYNDDGRIEFVEGNLLDQETVGCSTARISVVFHLAADHGSRRYVDLYDAACATNLALDGSTDGPS